MEGRRELAFLRLDAAVRDHLDDVRDTDKALRLVARATRDFFEAEEACIAVAVPGEERVELELTLPEGADWDRELLAAFLRGDRPRVPRDVLLAAVERYGRRWATIGVRRGRPFDREDLQAVLGLSATFSRAIRRIDRLRYADVRARIDRKIMEQLRPKDLFYQILHGLRSLLRYDHSAAVLTYDDGTGLLEVAAEQIAWRKGKSRRVGLGLEPGDEVLSILESGAILGFDRDGEGWREWEGREVEALARALDFDRVPEPGEEGEARAAGSLLCAPLATGDGLLGVLRIAALRPGALAAHEAGVVESFLPSAAVATRNLRRAESLELGMVRAEKKHAVADIARGVAHDVNNALGSMLPLVQQMRADLAEGRFDALAFAGDLEQVESSIRFCHRIFGGMLSFAKGAARTRGEADVARAVSAVRTLLEKRLQRRAVEVEVDLGPDLPRVRGDQAELEQVVLNLATNALESMPRGGRLSVLSVADGEDVLVEIADTGEGIPAELLARIQEPFFTTKRHGNGLGLAIVRSIVWGMRGSFTVESQPGQGTCVRLRLPAVLEEEEEDA